MEEHPKESATTNTEEGLSDFTVITNPDRREHNVKESNKVDESSTLVYPDAQCKSQEGIIEANMQTNLSSGDNSPQNVKDGEAEGDQLQHKTHENSKAPKKHPSTPSEAFASILLSVGGFGKWQWQLTFLSACGLFTSMHNFGAVFVGALPDHWCKIDQLNLTVEESIAVINETIPWEMNKDGKLAPSKCLYFDLNYTSMPLKMGIIPGSSQEPKAITCSSWHYNRTIYSSTVISEWDLVCSRRWLQPTIQATFMLGILTGAVVFSFISDRHGRRKCTLICVVVFSLSSALIGFSSRFEMFLFLRFLTAAAGQGMYISNIINVSESAEGKGRTWLINIFFTSFAVGVATLTTTAYIFRDWRTLQFATGFPTLVLFIYFWKLPESPRWLFMKGRYEEGLSILKKMAETNCGELPDKQNLDQYINIIDKEIKGKALSSKSSSFFSNLKKLVRTPNMRRRSIIMFYTWFATSSVSYGIGFSGYNLNVSVYTFLWLKALTYAPIQPLFPLVYLRFGRRMCLICVNLMCGVFLLLILTVPTDYSSVNLALAVIGGHMSSMSFDLIFIYSPELVPTDVRGTFVGAASFWARIGSILSSYVVDLLGEIYYAIPSTIFGMMALLCAFLGIFLPETGNRSLPESFEEIESLPR